MARVYDRYVGKMQKVADINHAIAVLSWDKEVNLPKESAAHRSQQIATLAGLGHQEFTDKDFGNLLQRLSNMKSLNAKEKRMFLSPLMLTKKLQNLVKLSSFENQR